MIGTPRPSIDDRRLRTALEELVPVIDRGSPALVAMERRASVFASSARLHEIDATFANGTRLSLVQKELGPRGLLPAARRAKPRFVHNPVREIRVYRDLLATHRLDTPAYYGSVVEAGAKRFWLFLERVPGIQLRWTSDDAAWSRAAAWLAGAHASLQGDVDREDLSLLQYDRAYHLRWLARARRSAAATDRRRRETLAWIASRYHRIVDLLVALPRTVIHGQFFPSNVLVEEAAPGGRIATVDWEVAGIGPGVLDLAALTAGASLARREAMREAYRAAARAAPVASPSEPELDVALDHARLALAVQWLGWSASWSPPDEQAHDWLTEAVQLTEALA